jgi:hypothetical protein
MFSGAAGILAVEVEGAGGRVVTVRAAVAEELFCRLTDAGETVQVVPIMRG